MKIQHDPTGEYRCSEGTNCPWCGCLHYGSTVCPYSPAHKEKPWPKPAEGEREYFYRNKGEHLYHKCSDYTTLEALAGALKRIVSDFETDYVLSNGEVVDDPAPTHRMAWEVARRALAEQGHKGATK